MHSISSVVMNVSRCSVHFIHPHDMIEDIGYLKSTGYLVAEIVVSGDLDKSELIDRLYVSMQFPEYCGRNFDAVEDCLRDLDRRFSGYVLLVHESDDFWVMNTDLAMTVTSIWLSCSDYWTALGRPFHLIFC